MRSIKQMFYDVLTSFILLFFSRYSFTININIRITQNSKSTRLTPKIVANMFPLVDSLAQLKTPLLSSWYAIHLRPNFQSLPQPFTFNKYIYSLATYYFVSFFFLQYGHPWFLPTLLFGVASHSFPHFLHFHHTFLLDPLPISVGKIIFFS